MDARLSRALDRQAILEQLSEHHRGERGECEGLPRNAAWETISRANETVSIGAGKDSAVAESYALMVDRGGERLTGGRFIDHLEFRGGQWRVDRTTFVTDWSMPLAAQPVSR